jgi:hypothetical protein
VQNFAGRGKAPRASRRARAARRAEGSGADELGDPIPFPPRKKKSDQLMVGLAAGHRGYTRPRLRAVDGVLRREWGCHKRQGFSKKDGRLVARVLTKKNRVPVVRLAPCSRPNQPCGWWLALRDNGSRRARIPRRALWFPDQAARRPTCQNWLGSKRIHLITTERHREAGTVHVGSQFWRRLGLDEILAFANLLKYQTVFHSAEVGI